LAVVPVVAVWCVRSVLAPWVFMWLMAGSLFLSAKWLTLLRARKHAQSPVRTLAYFFLWPGMDARNFLTVRSTKRSEESILFALAKIGIGAALVFGLARMGSPDLVKGWMGMVGLVLILHFGIFDLLAIAWRKGGAAVRPIMDAPIKSTSLAEFWGRRWNGAFNQLALDLLFRNLARRFGTTLATLGSFLFSGLLHELVISLPAAGGYGLPTGYFLLQGAGATAQRKWDLRRGFLGWILTMAIVIAPAFWLFHPLFVRRVVLPFLQAIGAL
jgi:alginate O-acetyltransferase complex protein AlgI